MNEFWKPDGPGKVMFKQSGGKIVMLTPEVRRAALGCTRDAAKFQLD